MSSWLLFNLCVHLLTTCSVVALSKLYDLNDPRLASIQVKGDLIVPQSDRIMTRSRARQHPDQYNMISAQLKIIKIFVSEVLSDSPNRSFDDAAAADFDEADGDDGEWEDDPTGFLDLGTGATKAQLMALGAEDTESNFARERDDETQKYLLEFFRKEAQKSEFAEVFNSLNHEEQEKLRSLG